ncbi:MAG TPA: ATP-binding protein [Ktedonobacterales bacterium]
MNRYDTSEIERTTPQAGSASVDAASALSTEPAELAVHVAQISALESESHKWREIFDAVADPICVVRADFHVECANAAYIALFGDVEHASSHYQCFALDVRGVGPCVGCPLPETVRTGRPGFVQQELLVKTPHNREPEHRIFQRWTYPIVNSDGAVERAVEVLKDVTEQERLRRAKSLAEGAREADRLKSELLGTVSHELRSPLAAIKGYAATLVRHDRRLPRAERLDYLQAIVGASDRLEVLINQLLELSELETGSITLHRFPEDVVILAREALAQAERRTIARREQQLLESGPEERDLTFALRVEGEDIAAARDLPLVRIDARLIREVLDNLLDNAIKYSRNGGLVEVILRLVRRVPGEVVSYPATVTGEQLEGAAARWLDIAVRDTGAGIPPDQLGRIFERFHRVDTRLTRDVDGMGLGLAICKRIVELHSGFIWVESEPGAGSVFHVLLPVSETDDMSS